jgi:hypothetical protein
MSNTLRVVEDPEKKASCAVSGTEFHTTTRLLPPFDPPRIAYILSASINEAAVTCVGCCSAELFATSAVSGYPEYED